jgi:tetratricopeptide (TPR) repeat protein
MDIGGPVAGIVVALFILMCLPVSTMVMAVEQSFRQAINPIVLINVIRAIGEPYFLLYVFLILLTACQGVISAIIGSFDTFLLAPVKNFIGLYFMLIMYNMMGYVIFQYHEALGHNVRLEVDKDYSNNKPTSKKPVSTNPVIQEAEVLIKEGQIDEAIKRLQAATNLANASNELHAYLHRVLYAANKPDLMIAHGNNYINVLLHENKTRDAAQLIIDCFKFKETIRPNDADKYYALVYMLNEMRAFKACISLIQNFHKRFPGHADIPKLYLLASKIMSEQLNNDAMALKMLEFLQAKYRQHELAAEIEQYCKVVKNVAGG